jgi:hypothetical protein
MEFEIFCAPPGHHEFYMKEECHSAAMEKRLGAVIIELPRWNFALASG